MKVIETLADLDECDEDVLLSGYRAGLGFIPIDHTCTAPEYWHGYWNGQVDRGLVPIAPNQVRIADEYVRRMRAQ